MMTCAENQVMMQSKIPIPIKTNVAYEYLFAQRPSVIARVLCTFSLSIRILLIQRLSDQLKVTDSTVADSWKRFKDQWLILVRARAAVTEAMDEPVYAPQILPIRKLPLSKAINISRASEYTGAAG